MPGISQSFRDHLYCHCHETGTITSVSCISIVNNNYSQPVSPHHTVCTYPKLKVSFSYQSLFSFRLNPSPSFPWLLPYANVKGSYTKQWDGKEWGQKHLLTRAVLPADSQPRTRGVFLLAVYQHKGISTMQIYNDKGDPEMQKDFNDWPALESWLYFACNAYISLIKRRKTADLLDLLNLVRYRLFSSNSKKWQWQIF